MILVGSKRVNVMSDFSPPPYKPVYFRCQVDAKGKIRIHQEERNLLIYFMSSKARDRLTSEEIEMYRLIWKNWAQIDKKCFLRLLGFAHMGSKDHDELKDKMAKAYGTRLCDIGIIIESYFGTWKWPPVRKPTIKLHERLDKILPDIYKIGAKLMSDGAYTKNRPFKDVVVIARQLNEITKSLYEDQIQLISTRTNKARLDWLNELNFESLIFIEGCKGILGKNPTTSLMQRV